MPRIRTGHKKDRILDAAIALFSEQGYENTTIGQIASRAKVAAGTVYLYFRNKEDILRNIFKRFAAGYDRELRERLKSLETPRRQLEALIKNDLQIIQETPNRARLFLFELRHGSENISFIKEELISRYEHYLDGILTPAAPAGRPDIHMLAVMLSGILENLLYDWMINRVEYDAKKIRDYLIRFILGPQD